jgi:hypothetical protein
MTSETDATKDLSACPYCGEGTLSPACASCGYTPAARTKQSNTVDVTFGGAAPAVTFALLGFVVGSLLSAATPGVPSPLVGAAFGAFAGLILGALVTRWLQAARLAWRVRAYMRAVPLRAIADVRDGLVRVRGRVSVIRPVRSPSGVACVAWERRTGGAGPRLKLQAEGGVFEIDDGSGIRAIVDATHLGVPVGTRVGTERVVLDGAEVELVGRARWVTPHEKSTQLSSQRVAARRVEVFGATRGPVIIRQLAPSNSQTARPGAPTGVRAVLPSPVHPEPDGATEEIATDARRDATTARRLREPGR